MIRRQRTNTAIPHDYDQETPRKSTPSPAQALVTAPTPAPALTSAPTPALTSAPTPASVPAHVSASATVKPLKFDLPWIEKYRPVTLDEIIDHQEKILTLRSLIANNEMTHLIFDSRVVVKPQ